MKKAPYQVIILLFSVIIIFLFWQNDQLTQKNKEYTRAIIENNEVFGSLFDKRKVKDIVRDMYQKEPVVEKITDWTIKGPENVDLKGWDDDTFPQSTELYNEQFRRFLEQIQKNIAGKGLIKYRKKDLSSLVNKLRQKNLSGKTYSLDNIHDLYGFRLVFPQLKDVEKSTESIMKKYNVIHADDYYKKPKNSGYRSIHLIIDNEGVIIEGQIRTEGMEIWSEWTHDFLYKNQKAVIKNVGQEKFNEFLAYSKKMADYIHALESCQTIEKPITPDGLEMLWRLSNQSQKKYLLPSGEPNLQSLKVDNCTR